MRVVVFLVVFGSNLKFGASESDEEESNRFSEDSYSSNHFHDTLPGEPLLDYPTYMKIPQTGFSCKGKVNWHYYADIDTGCQVFHVCESEYTKISFLCPTGSVFNQKHLVCDWWYNVDCSNAQELYRLSFDYNDDQTLSDAQERI